MEFEESTLDDLLNAVYSKLTIEGEHVSATKGSFNELRGATLRLSNPRARLSRSQGRSRAFSALGEFAWYISGSSSTEQICYYIPEYQAADEDGAIASGYGPRLMGSGPDGQLNRVTELLREKPTSRRAVIQLFDRHDLIGKPIEVPCTCTIQFLCRDERLHAHVTMRSNDAYLGLPHDIFAFTMLQELTARALRVEVGEYVHTVGSLHLYDTHRAQADAFVQEGFQSAESMPPMPDGDPWPSLREFIVREEQIRAGRAGQIGNLTKGYWDDLARLLIAFTLNDPDELAAHRATLASSYFDLYVKERQFRKDGTRS